MSLRATLIVVIIIVLGLVLWASGLYTDLLWFENLGYGFVFWNVFLSQWTVRLAGWLIFFLFLFVNLLFTRHVLVNLPNLELREKIIGTFLGRYLTPRKITLFLFVASLFLSFLFSSYTANLWLEARQFMQGIEFGLIDPIFHRDASFYVFQLPFLRSLYAFLQSMAIFTIILTGIVYFVANPPVQVGRRLVFLPYHGQSHLSLLLAFSFALKAWDYRLKMFELLLSPGGSFFGPGYTDLKANLPALWILLFIALLIVGLLVFNIFRRQTRLIFIGIGTLIAASIIVGSIFPSLVQQFRVDPNELAFERPFLENNINFTLKAYNLDKITTQNYAGLSPLEVEDLDAAAGTIENVRLWDYRPLLQTYNQLQGIRQYYEFVDVDTDRYYLDGKYRQVMLAARELNQSRLAEQARTWINLRLQYTHSYGLTMSPVNTVTEQGLPEFVIGDIPPFASGGLEVEKPEIYYGEISGDYVIVNTRTPEFNYPQGDENIYTHYEGTGGVPLKGIGRKLLYALKFSDYRILLSGEITGESRIMFNRSIRERVAKIAPFLRYDDDPYLVLSAGRLYWVLDAYTVSRSFPYAEPFGGINYMRNSVKVVVDAYNGSVVFYMADPVDPVILTYAKIFPGLFQALEEMPTELFSHMRYPETFLSLQARVYATYHMTDPVVFYTREDLWRIPNEKYAGSFQPVEPYYTILQLPGEEEPEFVLIIPFTPAQRDNMIAWMAGRCDGKNYGELLVYLFPKDKVVYGPMQIETRIDQDTLISQQLSLWDQRGSRVIRGNLLVLPVNESVLYVEPVFLQAEQSELPELVRVIVAFQDVVVMEPTLEQALLSAFGARGAPASEAEEPDRPIEPEPRETAEPEPGLEPPATVPELARRAQEVFQQAQASLKNGDWAGYGQRLQELEQILEELARLSGAATEETEP
ncbi:MAG TPA: UPF0182 family protein [Firmicutes bacterium]|jgi:uncharacterized membrane protein (UPF0182 family)|nr:COG1615 family transporter [Bacillota bacterium]HAA34613.1 UPF0182 family protein [Bacillota bacterium]